jgi:hypothetical protein
MKSYTDIEQSRKLAEILPLESADMKILPFTEREYRVVPINDISVCDRDDEIPCWSLLALFGVLPTIDDEFEPQLHRSLDKYFCTYEGEEDSSGLWRVADNPIDACYEMILKLHELKLL